MGTKAKYSQDKVAKAVERYAKGESVASLAKEYKVSQPGMYLWIAKARQNATEQVRRQGMSERTADIEQSVSVELQLKAALSENDRLKRKLLDLMIKSGELEL